MTHTSKIALNKGGAVLTSIKCNTISLTFKKAKTRRIMAARESPLRSPTELLINMELLLTNNHESSERNSNPLQTKASFFVSDKFTRQILSASKVNKIKEKGQPKEDPPYANRAHRLLPYSLSPSIQLSFYIGNEYK